MGFLNGLTLLLIYLQLTGQIEWSWWQVLAPQVVQFLFSILDSVLGDAIEARGGWR